MVAVKVRNSLEEAAFYEATSKDSGIDKHLWPGIWLEKVNPNTVEDIDE